MSENILVFSDGTGQAGGRRPDENGSNIYKMFRATRCGPDTKKGVPFTRERSKVRSLVRPPLSPYIQRLNG